MHNMVALLAGDGGPEEEVTRATRELFPSADGWRDHQAFWTEITQGMPLRS
jgi:hypothetical protein